MPSKTNASGSKRTELAAALSWLERQTKKKTRDGMSRYGIVARHALGVPVGTIRSLAKRIGRDHELAAALWDTGIYEARLLAAFVADPARVTPREMDRWCKDFENWADCDTACFALFDRTPHAFAKIEQWSTRRSEFEKRAAFALLASVALHDKKAGNDPFVRCLPLIEKAASDDSRAPSAGLS